MPKEMAYNFKMAAHNSDMTSISDSHKESQLIADKCDLSRDDAVLEEGDEEDFDEIDGFFFSSNKGTYKPRDLELETQLEESDDEVTPLPPDTCSTHDVIMYLIDTTSTKRWRGGILGVLTHCKQEENIRKSLLVLYDKIKWFLDKLNEDEGHEHSKNDHRKSENTNTHKDQKRQPKSKAAKQKQHSNVVQSQNDNKDNQKDQQTELDHRIDHTAHCFTHDDLYSIIPGYLSLHQTFGDHTETPEVFTENGEWKTGTADDGDTVDRIEYPDGYVLEGLSHLVRNLLYLSYTNLLLLPTVDVTLMQHLSRTVELLTDGHGIPIDSKPALYELMDNIPSIMKSLGFKQTTIVKRREIKSSADDFDVNECDVIQQEEKDLKPVHDDLEHKDISGPDPGQSELTLTRIGQSNERKDTDPEEEHCKLKCRTTDIEQLKEGISAEEYKSDSDDTPQTAETDTPTKTQTSACTKEENQLESDVIEQASETDNSTKTQTNSNSQNPEPQTDNREEQQTSNLAVNRKCVTCLQWQLPEEHETFNRLRFVILGLYGGLLTDI